MLIVAGLGGTARCRVTPSLVRELSDRQPHLVPRPPASRAKCFDGNVPCGCVFDKPIGKSIDIASATARLRNNENLQALFLADYDELFNGRSPK